MYVTDNTKKWSDHLLYWMCLGAVAAFIWGLVNLGFWSMAETQRLREQSVKYSAVCTDHGCCTKDFCADTVAELLEIYRMEKDYE